MMDSADKTILVVNAGSSSIKFALFDRALGLKLSGSAVEIGGKASFSMGDAPQSVDLPDHHSALNHILSQLHAAGLKPKNLAAAAHRVVHGGQSLTAPCRITPQVRAEIATCSRLAPLHNPANLAGIDALGELVPDLPQFASFDTAFHATNPAEAVQYALPPEITEQGLRRYGFHGTSYAALIENYPGPLPQRLLAMHLGNGASLCAIQNGQSVATTMGYSPVSGLTMGTRVGDIDANAVLDLAEQAGNTETRHLLNHRAGLLGMAGSNDLREILATDTDAARFAIKHFTYWIIRQSGAMISAMGGLDGVAFTGGIGENATTIRTAIMDGLGWTGLTHTPQAGRSLHRPDSPITALIVPAREEQQIAKDAIRLLES